jgi:hypothetical protein
LKIVSMDGKLCPLRYNLAQLKVHNTLELQRKAGFPMRAIVLKARREGVSTAVQGRFFYEININQMRNASIVSADLDASDKVFAMSRLFQDNLPNNIKRSTDYSNRKEITYSAPHLSKLTVSTAGKDVLGRGGLTHYLHVSEFAFWKDAKNQFGGAAQEVPDDPDTMIVIESTANGVGGAFYDMYMQYYDDFMKSQNLRNFLPIFLPWFIFPKYRMEIDDIFEIGKPHADGFDSEWLLQEQEFVDVYGCTPEQLMWRRWAIKNKCQGDLALFNQEYPYNVQSAFQSSGRPVFSHSIITKQEALCPKESYIGLFNSDDDYYPVHRQFNSWQMFRKPVRNHEYCMGIDTMVGRLSDKLDESSGSDRHGVAVYDRTANEFVCFFHGDLPQYELAGQVLHCAKYYNDAWLAPELPNGMETLNCIRESGYANIYNRSTHDDCIVVMDGQSLGWKTTVTTRPWLIENFKKAVSGDIRLNSRLLLDEMRTFIYDRAGKPTHTSGKHDDILFAAMIAMQVHLRCPINEVPYGANSTYSGGKALTNRQSLSKMGAIDSDEDIEDSWLTTS